MCRMIFGHQKVSDDMPDDFRATKKAADGSRTRLSGLGSQRTTDVLQPHNKYILRRMKGFFNHNLYFDALPLPFSQSGSLRALELNGNNSFIMPVVSFYRSHTVARVPVLHPARRTVPSLRGFFLWPGPDPSYDRVRRRFVTPAASRFCKSAMN